MTQSNFNQDYLNEQLSIGIDIDEEYAFQEQQETQEEVTENKKRSKSQTAPVLPPDLWETEQ